jgi:hypothetical protein
VVHEELDMLVKEMSAFKVEGRVHKPLPLLNGRVRQLEDGTCIYESQTSNLSKGEQ